MRLNDMEVVLQRGEVRQSLYVLHWLSSEFIHAPIPVVSKDCGDCFLLDVRVPAIPSRTPEDAQLLFLLLCTVHTQDAAILGGLSRNI